MIHPVITILASLMYVAWRIVRMMVICGVVLSLVVSAFIWWIRTGTFSTSKFDSNKWLTQPNLTPDKMGCYRGGMAMDLKNNLLKPGMTKEAVHALLGKPNETTKQEDHYVLGMCSVLKWNVTVLRVFYGPDDKLKTSDVYFD